MESVVENGTGARPDPGGRRGGQDRDRAARRAGRKAHAWFISFAPADDPEIAVAVIAEDGGIAGSEGGGGHRGRAHRQADHAGEAGPVTPR